MPRRRPVALPLNLADWALETVTVTQLAEYTGIPGRTIRYHCRTGVIVGAYRRNHKPESEWMIPIAEARRIEVAIGLTVKRLPAA